jgi:hypothetical protein
MIAVSEGLDGPQQKTECKAHGAYVSTFWTLPAPRGTVSSWSGCPACVREQVIAKRGGRKASFRFAHRPSYEMVTVRDGEETRETVHG